VIAKDLGLSTHFDSTTPLAPYGSMFWARPESLAKLVDHPWTWEDYPSDAEYGDGALPHVQERLMAYTALDAGYQVRCVINRDWASINYCFLEYKLQRISALLPAYTQEQVDFITQITTDGPALHQLKATIDEVYPRLGAALRPGYRVAKRTRRTARKLLGKD
jgi:lipopolysaccharide biosynthesis protein